MTYRDDRRVTVSALNLAGQRVRVSCRPDQVEATIRNLNVFRRDVRAGTARVVSRLGEPEQSGGGHS